MTNNVMVHAGRHFLLLRIGDSRGEGKGEGGRGGGEGGGGKFLLALRQLLRFIFLEVQAL